MFHLFLLRTLYVSASLVLVRRHWPCTFRQQRHYFYCTINNHLVFPNDAAASVTIVANRIDNLERVSSVSRKQLENYVPAERASLLSAHVVKALNEWQTKMVFIVANCSWSARYYVSETRWPANRIKVVKCERLHVCVPEHTAGLSHTE